MRLVTSIKHQALIMFTGFSLGLTLLFFALSTMVAFIVEDIIISRLLTQEVEYIEQAFQASGQLLDSRLDFVVIYKDESELPPRIKAGIKRSFGDNELFTDDDRHFHFEKMNLSNLPPAYLIAEVSPLLAVTTTKEFIVIAVFGLGLALILSALLAYKMADKTVRPVLAISDAIKSKRKMPKLEHELGYLADTMQTTLDGLNESLERERHFSDDINHELRTPLTIFRNTLSLAEQRGIAESDLKELKSLCTQMHNTVDVLMALARAEDFPSQTCNLKQRIEDVAIQCASLHHLELEFDKSIDTNYAISTNSNLLDLLLINLINNAIAHSGDGKLVVSQQGASLILTNSNIVLHAGDLTQAGVKRDQSLGSGQGLFLVKRIIETLGWEYSINQTPTQFSIRISP